MVYGMQEDANKFYIGLVNKLLNMTERSKIEQIYAEIARIFSKWLAQC